MKRHLLASPRKKAQTLVLFILVFGAIVLLLGLAIDSGLLYLAKARLSRAVDGAALAAVGNFNLGNDQVAKTMRNFAAANFSDLNSTATTATGVQSSYTLANGQTALIYTYSFNDTTLAQPQDSNGQYKRYVEVILKTGSGGQITSATCNARCPVRTYFMGYAGAFFKDLKVSSSAVATRNPRLIMVVVDRSGSMLGTRPDQGTYGGAYGLPASIVTFLNFFDTTSDYIGLVSFSSNARLEMPLTTNFLYDGTNVLFDTYQIDTNGVGIPGVDPEDTSATHATFSTNGVRRMKFGGSTAADEGMRLALEQMMASAGFNNPDVNKYIVLFTDGAWNNARSLLAAPGYTNVTIMPTKATDIASMPNGVYETNGSATNTIPAFSPYVDYTNAIVNDTNNVNSPGFPFWLHTNDVWQSVDSLPQSGVFYESDQLGMNGPTQSGSATHTIGVQGLPVWPNGGASVPNMSTEGQPITVTNYPYIGTDASTSSYMYTTNLNVWLTPGSVDYVYDGTNSIPTHVYVSNLNVPEYTQDVAMYPAGSNVLVVPGYLVDGTFTDSLDLPYPQNQNYPAYRVDGYTQPYMWPDDQNNPATDNDYLNIGAHAVDSVKRNLMFRNYINLLTGYYIYRADDPLQVQVTGGFEPLAPTDAYPAGYPRPLHGLGPYYPSAGFYWPFDLVGTGPSINNPLADPLVDPSGTDDPNARNISWSINMLSTNAAPNWAGELYYTGSQGTNVFSIATSVSTQITTSSTWENGAPDWLAAFIQNGKNKGILLDDPSHYGTGSTNIINGTVLRPVTFNGSNNVVSSTNSISQNNDPSNLTGGYVTDGAGNYYRNAMAYSGRPTHYYNFATGSWTRIQDNHIGTTSQGLGEWRAREYAWHARAAGVTIYTVGYGGSVNNDECVLLAEVANATNVMLKTGPSTNFLSSSYNTQQPIGQEFYATTTNDISNDFYQVGTAINAALTQ